MCVGPTESCGIHDIGQVDPSLNEENMRTKSVNGRMNDKGIFAVRAGEWLGAQMAAGSSASDPFDVFCKNTLQI